MDEAEFARWCWEHADVLSEHWHLGDGDGGWVLQQIRAAVAAHSTYEYERGMPR